MIELLESRIAPAIVFTYTDLDGDRVTVTISKGSLGDATFTHPPVPGLLGDQLQTIDLNGNDVFNGASITITAKPQLIAGTFRGDGLVNVGFLDATGIDLGPVTVSGDLGKIQAGDTDPVKPGLAALTVGSLGRWGTTTGAPDTNSQIEGKLGAITVRSDLLGAVLADGIGKVKIGGTHAGFLSSDGSMGVVKIGGDLSGTLNMSGKLAELSVGGSIGGRAPTALINVNSDAGMITVGGDFIVASIQVGGELAGVKIGGAVSGNLGFSSAQISSIGDMGVIKIGGDLSGAARIIAAARLEGVSIGGSVVGNNDDFSARITSSGKMGAVKIRGDFVGGRGDHSAEIVSGGKLVSVTIGGSMIGGPGDFSANIVSAGDIGALFIGGSVRGGSPLNGGDPSIDGSAYIEGGRIGSIFIGGSIIAGFDFNNADAPTKNASIRARDDIGSLTVRGSLIGNTNGDDVDVIISARGQSGLGATAKNDVAIGKITIGGGTSFARILAGYDVDLAGRNADAQIGTVKIGRDVLMTNIIAGVQDGGDGFGTFNDTKISGVGVKDNADSLGAVSRILSVIIKGAALGTLASNDDALFGIEAQHLASVRVGGATLPLRPGAGNDLFLTAIPLGPTRTPGGDGFDFHAFEVAAT